MAHYAVLDENNRVIFVHPGKDEGEDGIDWEAYYGAKRTSYNTRFGQHPHGTPYRYNYAGEGYTFSDAPEWAAQGGAFIPPQPFPSWTLNPETALWDAPVPHPGDGLWRWDEDTLAWVALT